VARVDIVVVSYYSASQLRDCVAGLACRSGFNVIVADNASGDDSLEVVADLPVETIALPRNGGFSYGCNAGWRAGDAPHVLFLNPDARIDAESLNVLTRLLEDDPRLGAVGPRISDEHGNLDFSQRRFPSFRSTLSVALALHRLLPRARWTDEMMREPDAYATPSAPDWLSGACLLVRRSDLEALGGLDEQFFLYCEDTDLCLRIRRLGRDIRFEPTAKCAHAGGASAPRAHLLPIHVGSRIRYARKHGGFKAELGQRSGIALGALLRLPFASGASRTAQARALLISLGLVRPPRGA
jgi:GT2 family glycosyltransferase